MSEIEARKFGEFTSKVLLTLPGSASVRTTVPQVIANLLDAAPGSTLVWTFDKRASVAVVRLKREAARRKSSKTD